MKEKRSHRFVFGVALGFGAIAAALWWVRRQRKPRRQPLILQMPYGRPAAVASGSVAAESPAPWPSRTRHAVSTAVSAALLTLLVGGIVMGLVHSTWAINGTVNVSREALAAVRLLREELAQASQASQAVKWLDSALQPATYGGDLLIYLKEATAALPPEALQARQTLRTVINELQGSR